MDSSETDPPRRCSPSNPSPVQDQRKEMHKQKQNRICFFPPIITTQSQGKERAEPGTITQYDDKRGLQEQCFLAELSRIEQELRDKVKREQERQEALERARLEENRERWRSLCFVSLNQRVNKPWVFSFYRTFPMHIYCLPIQAPSNRNKRKKKFRR